MQLRLHPDLTYLQLKDYLVSNLDRQQDRSAQLLLETRFRKDGETLQEFAAELRSAAYDAYQNMNASPEIIDTLVLQTFH